MKSRYGPRYGRMTVKFIPVKHGDVIDVGDLGVFGISGTHKYVGFKPGRGAKREGWLVVLVAEGSRTAPKRTMTPKPKGKK